ncbi:MAG: LuxR C-terminal-related transcriptional regulator [Deltaproteobacteria bacterium]|nr:LuxR C-terminal-related transcriptional regulator [Deltaproteobacteria bacterium]
MSILLCSANRAVISRWKNLLADQYSLSQAASVGELQSCCAAKNYDLILLHRLLIDTATFLEIRRLAPASKFFLLSDQPDEEEGLAFLKLGIAGYGNTYIGQGRLTEAVRVILAGGVWLGQKVIQQLILETYAKAQEKGAPALEQRLAGLTRMEHKVAELVARGRTNLEIAADLDIAERTVKAHLTSVYEKTKTGSRLSLALLINRG